MAGAAVAALLPASWTGCAGGLLQPMGWFEWALSGTTRRARATGRLAAEPAPTREQFRQLREHSTRLARQVAEQKLEIDRLERQIAQLAGLRETLGELRAKIVFATVVGGDASPQRETLTISKGRRAGVRPGDWVTAGVPPAEREPEATGRDLVVRQWLIGRVSQVQPYLSSVQLASDPGFGPQRVWLARQTEDGGWQLADRQCGLEGAGKGRMRIDRAASDYLASGHTAVLVALAEPRHAVLAIGRVVGSRTLETGLHYDLSVEPWGDPRALSHVYVLSVSP
jgi:cell shape-determining protein MreC